MVSWEDVAIALLIPLALVAVVARLWLTAPLKSVATYFAAGASLAFAGLLAEHYLAGLLQPWVPRRDRTIVAAFVLAALTEELLKIAQIVQLSERRDARTLHEIIAIALPVAAGFAGAENVVYLFRYANEIANLLLVRTFTAVPMHLAAAVVASRFIFMARQGPSSMHYYAVAVIVATAIHGLYDYLIMASRGQSSSFLFVLGFVLAWAWRITRTARAPHDAPS